MQVIQDSLFNSVSFHLTSEMPLLVFVHSRDRPFWFAGVDENANEIPFYVHAYYSKGNFGNEEIGTSTGSCNSVTEIKFIKGIVHVIQVFLSIACKFRGPRKLLRQES